MHIKGFPQGFSFIIKFKCLKNLNLTVPIQLASDHWLVCNRVLRQALKFISPRFYSAFLAFNNLTFCNKFSHLFKD